jgi:hypothetical protein
MDDVGTFDGFAYRLLIAYIALYKLDTLGPVICIQYVKYAHPFAAIQQARDEQIAEVSGAAGYDVQVSH